jgi:hypothetical protein
MPKPKQRRNSPATRRAPARATTSAPRAAANGLDPGAGPADAVARIEEVVASAIGVLGDAPAPEPPAAPADGLDTAALVAAWQQAVQAQQGFENLTTELAELRRQVADELTAHQDKTADLAAREQRLAAAEKHAVAAEDRRRVLEERLEQRTAELDERDARLLAEETALAMRRQREKEELLADVRVELATTQERLAAQLRSMEEEADRQREKTIEDLAREREAIAAERAQAAEERKRLRERAVELDAREEDLVDTKALYAERERLAVAAATEGLQRRWAELDALYRGAREDADRLERQLAERNELIRVLGTDQPAEAAAELARLRGESAELRRLKLIAPDETRDRLIASEQERQRLREERAVLLQHNEQLQLLLSGHQITAVELERLKVSKEAMRDAASLARRHPLGRYAVLPGTSSLLLDGRPMRPGEYLAGAGRWRLKISERSGAVVSEHGDSPMPAPALVGAVRVIGTEVAVRLADGRPLADLVAVSPVINQPEAEERLDRQALEEALEDDLRYLAAACSRPAIRLRPVIPEGTGVVKPVALLPLSFFDLLRP